MSPQRRDAEGRRQTAHSWESLVERQIREAIDGGAFEELPYRGERIPIDDDSAAGEWAMAHRILREAGVAPPWIEADKEARRLMAAHDALVDRAPTIPLTARGRARMEGATLIANANRAIARLNHEAPTIRQHRRPLDAVAEAARLEAAFEGT